jgi:hypothetical protein
VPSLTFFDSKITRTAKKWFKRPSDASCVWSAGRRVDNLSASTEPYLVESKCGLKGFAKPGKLLPNAAFFPAHEKIAADFATILQLPIPPVILHEWPVNQPDLRDDLPRKVSISLEAFDGSTSPIDSGLSADTILCLRSTLTAMWVFDSWISAENRAPRDQSVVSSGFFRLFPVYDASMGAAGRPVLWTRFLGV